MQDMKLPPEVALMPDQSFYRAGQNQLIPNLFVGTAQAQGSAPDDLFHVTEIVKGVDAAGPLEDSGCKMMWPT
jgi:branched-chain amino acid transport system substrate-binding protein